MLRKGIKNFDEITVLTFLEDYPDLKSEYESKGGWKSIREYMNILDINNVEAYYNELMKNNLLIQLEKKGFDVENVTALNKLNTADDGVDYFDAVLNAAALSISHDIKLEKLSYTDKDIERKKKGEDIQSPSKFPEINSKEDLKDMVSMLRERSNGRPIGIKIAAGKIEQDLEYCVWANPDFITIDGRGGATGSSPYFLREATSVPTIYALSRARKYLD